MTKKEFIEKYGEEAYQSKIENQKQYYQQHRDEKREYQKNYQKQKREQLGGKYVKNQQPKEVCREDERRLESNY